MAQETNRIESRPPRREDSPRPWWRRRWFKIVAASCLIALAGMAIAAEYIVRHAEPLLRASVVETLSSRFHSPVQLDYLGISLVRGVEVRGSGLRILYLAGPTQPGKAQVEGRPQPAAPMLSVRQFAFRFSLHDLLHLQARVANVFVEGMDLHIPPHSLNGLIDTQNRQHPAKRPRIALLVGTILCKDVKLTIETTVPGKDPLEIDIPGLQLTDVGPGRPLLYVADIINPKPTGIVHASGHFGPWQAADPRATVLDGVYTFDHVDLATIRGISGTLSSTGKFGGQLSHVDINGTTETPDFALDVSAHPEPLATAFSAYVDGTTGDTTLTQVQAKLKDSQFTTSGAIVRIHQGEGVEGHDIALTVDMPRGDIQDLLTLGMKTSPPVMRGIVHMRAKLNIPPGDQRVAKKMQLAGSLSIDNVEFTNPRLQDRVDGLSMRAQGKPKDVKAVENDRRAEVASQMAVDFSLANGTMTISSLRYRIPGATVLLDGVYSMDGNVFEFKGHVRTQAEASQMVTGWKSWLLKPVDPFLKKNGAGLQLPISISGTNGDVKFGLALHDSGESTGAMKSDLRQQRGQMLANAEAKRLNDKADREDIAAAKEKDLRKAEAIHNQAVHDRAAAQREAAASAPKP